MPLRAAGVCGFLALVTVSVGWIGGALAQPDAYSSADDDLSDLGALTAVKPEEAFEEHRKTSAHKMNNRFTVAATIAAPLILAFAFRRIPEWRGAWLPSLAAVPASIVCGLLFSGLGDGAAVRAGTLTWFAWVVFLAVRLMRTANARQVQTE